MTKFFDNIDGKNKYKLLHSFKADVLKYKENENITHIVFKFLIL